MDNDEPRERVYEIMSHAEDLPDGPAKVALIEEAVGLADAMADVELGMRVREDLIQAANSAGRGDVLIVAFAWCLAQCDRDPTRFSETEMFWTYKWVTNVLPKFPQFSRERIGAMLDDQDARYARHGFRPRPVLKLRCEAALAFGDLEVARALLARWQDAPADDNNDCAACEIDAASEAYLLLGDVERALAIAAPLVDTRRQSCAEVPHITYGRLLAPCLAMGDLERARRYDEQGYALVRGSPNFVQQVGEHMAYAALSGDWARGVRMLERHAGWLDVAGAPRHHFEWWLGARAAIAGGARESRRATRTLRLPRSWPIWRADGTYAWADLLSHADAKLDGLAQAFDRRNGNDRFAARVRTVRAG